MSALLHRLVLSIELGTVQTATGKVDPARKFKFTTGAAVCDLLKKCYGTYILDQFNDGKVRKLFLKCHTKSII